MSLKETENEYFDCYAYFCLSLFTSQIIQSVTIVSPNIHLSSKQRPRAFEELQDTMALHLVAVVMKEVIETFKLEIAFHNANRHFSPTAQDAAPTSAPATEYLTRLKSGISRLINKLGSGSCLVHNLIIRDHAELQAPRCEIRCTFGATFKLFAAQFYRGCHCSRR